MVGSKEAKAVSGSSLPSLLAALASGVRAVHGLPLDDEFAYESSLSEFSKSLSEVQDLLLRTLTKVLKSVHEDEQGSAAGGRYDMENIGDNIQDPLLWETCAETCEILLEQVETYLQNGDYDVSDAQATSDALLNFSGMARERAQSKMGRMVSSTVEMEKPQKTYNIDVSSLNSRDEPFVPKVHPDKPYSVTPLDLSLQPGHGLENRFGEMRSVTVSKRVVAPLHHVPHVYEQEIKSLDYRTWQLECVKHDKEIPIQEQVTAQWIDTVVDIEHLSKKLENVAEVAVDLEAHSYRSFSGMICLMQISFRSSNDDESLVESYLVDTLALWHHINSYLAGMFANPDIVKVMHGADSDIQWLQRDFGIYVVNLFDTGRAARALSLSSAGLAFLLQKYAGVEADKTHQLSDWRQRPLPDEMRRYAIMDTCYLLDIYDRVKWDVEQHKGTSIKGVLDESKKISLIRYAKEPFKPDGYKSLMRNRGSSGKKRTELNDRQEKVLAALWSWRDQMARAHDESLPYVCPNQALFRLSMSLPSSVGALQSLMNPISPLVIQNAQTILAIIKNPPKIGYDSEDEADVEVETAQVGAPSSAFFKPAESAGMDTKDASRSAVLSPVLGTEALYKQAGWITPLQGHDDAAEDDITSTSDEEDDTVDPARKPRHLLAVNSANRNYQSKQYTDHSLEMEGKDGRGRTVDGMGSARAIPQTTSSTMAAASSSTSSMEDNVLTARTNATRIRTGILAKKEDMLKLLIASDSKDEDDEILGNSETAVRNTGQSSDSMNTAGVEGDEEFVIPRSMKEIYKISNRNRRNKKVSSPTHDRVMLPRNAEGQAKLKEADDLLKDRGLQGGLYFDELGSPGNKRQRTKSSAGTESEDGPPIVTREDDVAFMQDVGWIKSKEDAEVLLLGHSNVGGTEGTGGPEEDEDDLKREGKASTTPTPFDYSATSAMGALYPGGSGNAAGNNAGIPGNNPFFAGAAMTGGPLTQGMARGDRKKGNNANNAGRGGRQGNRSRQDRHEKRDSRTHAYKRR